MLSVQNLSKPLFRSSVGCKLTDCKSSVYVKAKLPYGCTERVSGKRSKTIPRSHAEKLTQIRLGEHSTTVGSENSHARLR
jgi:hypothetical protein